ncbi:Cullin repeat-like-containing domain protein [Kalmanozyma brasiliensis GHG001]|uniref:Exocyst complex component EXO84 n=1 Tax=Kalmanozyma brasiliensis (strain GHG001) TaxID=1365824 RepID=V5EYZ8_KALBG|nr:Cullin repeat-like-containing domain protein [Kalmanozyma brasiliensis GHG001]EST09068.1 Cullin repeat-like-containing domain protein [Kalmanozyma brasiliensis GHG001]
MSRSLRTRPMTLYAQDGQQPVIPPLPSSSAAAASSSSSSTAYPYNPSSSQRQSSLRQARQDGSSSSSTNVLKKSKKKASQVGSTLKNRLSMRYAEPTQLGPGGFSAIPAVPALPPMPEIHIDDRPHHLIDDPYLPAIGESASDAAYDPDDNELNAIRKSSDTQRSRIDTFDSDPNVDTQLLSQSDFDPQAYLRAKLSQQTESSLRTFKASLATAKQAANDDIKRQVFTHYSEFITISKEIATLENDMLELKELLSEWKQLPQALELDDSSSTASFSDSFSRAKASGKANRNSTLDLQSIYRAQITSLWEGIEGSQKFLPYVPGRHLIAEASSFTELNAATYKPQQSVALFLLDDLLLIATRRKRQMSSKVRLVAERCFSLAEIVVIDLKDGGDLTNALKIKRARETYVYRTDRAQDKRALLNAFRRVAEELAKKRRNESEYGAVATARKRESTLLSSPPIAQHPFDALRLGSTSGRTDGGLLTPIGEDSDPTSSSSVMAAAAASAASERKDPGRWNNDFADELSVCIAHRDWDQAVSLIEKGRGVLSTYTATDASSLDLSAKLALRTAELVAAISGDFSKPHLKKSAVLRNASFLLRLDQGEKARQLFLDARTELLKRRTRQIKFEGDPGVYVSELAMVHFTLVKNTSEWYMAAFKDGRMASGFVQWAWERVEEYGVLFRRQVYGSEDETRGEMVREMKEISLRLAGQLRDVGLDFTFLLEQLLEPEPGSVSVEEVQKSAQEPAPPVIPKLVLTRSSRIGMEGEQTTREREAKRAQVASAQELRRQSVLHVN